MVQRLGGWYIVPTCSIFLALATVAVTLRFISRYKFGVKIGPDDILIIVALLFAYAHLIDIILCKRSAIQIYVLPFYCIRLKCNLSSYCVGIFGSTYYIYTKREITYVLYGLA